MMDTGNYSNNITLKMDSKSQNESLARTVVSAFISPLNPDMGTLSDIKTAVSEAVTNAIIHGYEEKDGSITLTMSLEGSKLCIAVSDKGVGIEDIIKAMEPLYTSTRPDMERAGMGFTVMESFMDEVKVVSAPGSGTTVEMTKDLKCEHSCLALGGKND